MLHKSIIFSFLLCLLGAAGKGYGQEVEPGASLYVSPDGNDNNSGSLNAPFRTIQHAIDNAQAGDVISIRKGTYRERLKIEELNGGEDAPITFENYQNEEVVLSGASPINSTWVRHENNIWKTNLNFDVSQLYLDGQMLTAARWPNITKEWDRLDDSDRRNATPDSYWDIEGTRALALVDPEVPDEYRNHESQQRLSDLDFSVDGAMLVPHKSFGLTHSGEIINHKAGESSFDIDPNFELWLRSPGQTALKNLIGPAATTVKSKLEISGPPKTVRFREPNSFIIISRAI